MQPNILQIICHDLGRHLGCYGVASVHTPTLDRLAGEGVRCAGGFCTSPGCSPSRATLATGRYPHANGVMGLAHAHFGWQLAPGERHIARLLGDAGYHTALFGLQHVTYQIETLGFHEIHGERPADGVTTNLERFFAARPTGKPLYVEVNFFEPHRPYDFGGVAPDTEHGVHVPAYLPENDATRGELAGLQGAIRKVDGCVSRILTALAAAGIADETFLLFTTDHGIAFPRAKTTLYDAGIEVALLARWPAGGIAAGRVCDALISNVDIVPTLLEAAGVAVPESVQGRSVLSTLREAASGERRAAIFAEKTYHEAYDPQRCVRTDRYKLIHHFEVCSRAYVPSDIGAGPTFPTMIRELAAERSMLELYDMQADPAEQNNLAADPAYAATLADLGRQLRTWMEATEDPLLHGPIPSPFYGRAIETLRSF
jgi:arylsulfatase A-like enzyme